MSVKAEDFFPNGVDTSDWRDYDGIFLPGYHWYDYLVFFVYYKIETWRDLYEFFLEKVKTKRTFEKLNLGSLCFKWDPEYNKIVLESKVDLGESLLCFIEDFSSGSLVIHPKLEHLSEFKRTLRLHGFSGFSRSLQFKFLYGWFAKHDYPTELTHVNDYRYSPRNMKFMGGLPTTKLYFGLELELSTEFSPLDLYLITTKMEPIQEPFFYIKHDGSVGGSGSYNYELVTFPCTPKFLKKQFKIFFDKVASLGDVSDFFDVTARATNGLHIHISQDSFSTSLWKNKFLSVINLWDRRNQKFLQALSRRTVNIESSTYCPPHRNMRDRTLAFRLKYGAQNLRSEDRRASARETDNTVEVRIFQSIVDINHICYCIDLTRAIHEFSEVMSIRDVGTRFSTSFTSWLGSQTKFKKLHGEVQKCV